MALKEPLLWQFSRGDLERRAVRMQAAIAIDTTPGVLAAVQTNGGLSVLPDFLVGDLVGSGQLVHVLPEWQLAFRRHLCGLSRCAVPTGQGNNVRCDARRSGETQSG